ncbi:unnamed protein product, partial [marine sediment metagenome]
EEKDDGEDALERFKEKEKKAKEKLGTVYDDPLWEDISEKIDELIETISEETAEETTDLDEESPEQEEILKIDIYTRDLDGRFYYGNCPKCRRHFNYDEEDVGRIMRCRYCNAPMKLVRHEEESQNNGG